VQAAAAINSARRATRARCHHGERARVGGC